MDVTGWTELLEGRLFDAIMALYTGYLGDWFLTLLFLAFKVMLFFGTRNILASFFASMIFLVVFYTVIEPTIVLTVVAIATIELALILYTIIFKK